MNPTTAPFGMRTLQDFRVLPALSLAQLNRCIPPRRPFTLRHPRPLPLPPTATSSVDNKIQVNKAPPTPITLTQGAVGHLLKLRSERGEAQAILRVGVKSGGCSGMSYLMDFITSEDEKKPDDTVLSFAEGEIEIRIDPKSLLYLFGLQLDYSSELIGGGYKFSNPNASSSCGCGTSFSV